MFGGWDKNDGVRLVCRYGDMADVCLWDAGVGCLFVILN